MLNNQIKAGVIGDPILQSLSPKIHNFFLEKYKINGSYEAILVKKENLHQEVQKLVDQGFAGFNVTIPHKEEMFKICDFKSKTASLTRAINTVIITKDKKLFGHNSDVEGFLNNLENFDLKNKNIFVIGAGGAARAIIYGLIKRGVAKIFITNRNENRALELIKDFSDFAKNTKLVFLNMKNFEDQLFECNLLVNSTSLGMISCLPLEINLEKLNKMAVVCDIVYKPLMTNLLIAAQKRGNKIITGIGMLVNQALIGFEAWFGKKAEIDQKLLENLYEID